MGDVVKQSEDVQSRLKPICYKLKLLLGLTMVLTVLVLIVSFVRFSHYDEGQKKAVDLMAALTDECEEGEYDEETIRDLNSYLNPRRVTYTIYGRTYDNSEVIEASNEADEAVGRLLTEAGYSCYVASKYFEYFGWFEYTFATMGWAFAILGIVMLIVIIVTIVVMRQKNKQIVVTTTDVQCWLDETHRIRIPLSSVVSLQACFLSGLVIKSNEKQFSMLLVDNRDEVFDAIKSKIAKTPTVVYVNEHENAAQSLKQYKELLDEGVITQEEYDRKKSQLLGL